MEQYMSEYPWLKGEREPKPKPDNDLYDGWMDRQFEKLQMAYCVDCKCFVDAFEETPGGSRIDEHENEYVFGRLLLSLPLYFQFMYDLVIEERKKVGIKVPTKKKKKVANTKNKGKPI